MSASTSERKEKFFIFGFFYKEARDVSRALTRRDDL